MDRVYHFAIKRQLLKDAISAYCDQTGLQLFGTGTMPEILVGPIAGMIPAKVALAKLVEGTAMTVKPGPNTRVLILEARDADAVNETEHPPHRTTEL